MKRLLFLMMLFVGCSKDPQDPSHYAGTGFLHLSSSQRSPIVVLAAGQSNMSGEYSGGALPLDTMVTSITGNRANRGYAFAVLLAHHTGRNVTLINCAVQGTSSDQWLPDGPLFANCVSLVKTQGIAPDYFLFSQGETDAGNSTQTPWATNFISLVSSLKATFGTNFQTIFTQIGQFNASPQPVNYQYIQDQQASVHLRNTVMVKTDDLVPQCGGGWHYCEDMEQVIAKRMISTIFN